MRFRQFLTAILILVLSSSPALAAYCTTACMQAEQAASMEVQQDVAMMDMDHCDHSSMQHSEKKDAKSHDHCSMAGCHAASLALFPVLPTQFHDLSAAHHPQFVPTAFSADTPPPIKPPA
jgi:uncharacterized protein involved in copper resistance